MKVVISKHGCYELPLQVVKEYFKLLNKVVYFYEDISSYGSIYNSKFIKTDKPKLCSFLITSIDCGDTTNSDQLYRSEGYIDYNEIERNDEYLVKAVENIKPHSLKVVEIPDDVKWYIYESETGFETIHEEHRIWY